MFAAGGAFRTPPAAVADPVCTSDAQHTLGTVQLVARTFQADAAVITDEISALRAFFAAHIADITAGLIAAATFFVTFAVILKAVTAVVTHFVIVITGATIAAVVLLIAGSAGAFTAVVAIFAQPIAVTV